MCIRDSHTLRPEELFHHDAHCCTERRTSVFQAEVLREVSQGVGVLWLLQDHAALLPQLHHQLPELPLVRDRHARDVALGEQILARCRKVVGENQPGSTCLAQGRHS